MGRPIKTAKLISGVPSDTGYDNGNGLGVVGGEVDTPVDVKTIACSFSLNGGGDLTGWIVRQKGTRKFIVTDGTVTGTCALVDKGGSFNAGEMSIAITTAAAATKYLVKFNDTIGTAGDGTIYHLTFGAASIVPPAGSQYQIATVAST